MTVTLDFERSDWVTIVGLAIIDLALAAGDGVVAALTHKTLGDHPLVSVQVLPDILFQAPSTMRGKQQSSRDSSLLLWPLCLTVIHWCTFFTSAQELLFQPAIQIVEHNLPGKAFSSLSFPKGSPWCHGAPTYWLTGHQWENTTESPYCYVNGTWTMSTTVALDDNDALAANDSITPRIDRHACVTMDVNHDGLLDIICVVGADSGQGEGFQELYFSSANGTITKLLQGHGLQKYTSLRTRVATTLRGPNDAQLLFIGTLGTRRSDGLPNNHRMFRNDYFNASILPYFNEVPGPFRKYYSALCAVPYDLSNNGVDDLLVCNEDGPAGLYFQDGTSGKWTTVRRTTLTGSVISKYLYGWRDVRVADVTGDGLADLIVVSQDDAKLNYLRIFYGIARKPYFDFTNVYYQKQLRYAAPAVELLDVNQDGWHDIYVVQSDQDTKGTYCSTANNPKPWGETKTPPESWVPPMDIAKDMLFLGRPIAARPGQQMQRAFQPIKQKFRLPGCGGPVAKQFGNNYTMLLAQGDYGHAGYNSILTWNNSSSSGGGGNVTTTSS